MSELSAHFLSFELKFGYFLTQEQQATFPLEKVLKASDTERQFGNHLYNNGNFERAEERYQRV